MNECYTILIHLMENKQQVVVVSHFRNAIIEVTGKIWLYCMLMHTSLLSVLGYILYNGYRIDVIRQTSS